MSPFPIPTTKTEFKNQALIGHNHKECFDITNQIKNGSQSGRNIKVQSQSVRSIPNQQNTSRRAKPQEVRTTKVKPTAQDFYEIESKKQNQQNETFEFLFSGQNIRGNPPQHSALPRKAKTTSSFLFQLKLFFQRQCYHNQESSFTIRNTNIEFQIR